MANRLTKLFKELAELPVYTSAYFLKSDPGSYSESMTCLTLNPPVRHTKTPFKILGSIPP